MSASSDILIVSVIPKIELSALKAAFGIELDATPTTIGDSLLIWFQDIITKNGQKRIALTCIGLQGNVVASSFVTQAIEATQPQAAFLVGICAGLKDKTNLGEVIVSSRVIGYEPARLEVAGESLQPDHLEPPFSMLQDILFFNPNSAVLNVTHKSTRRILGHKNIKNIDLITHNAMFASGEKLLADGSLSTLRTKYHEKIRGGEKEGIGFASACTRLRHPIPWLVIKGVGDFGGDDKDEKSDELLRQEIAAANASIFVKCFIESGLVESSRSRYFNLLNGRRDLLTCFESIFIEDVGENGEICLLSLVGGLPKFDPFPAIADALTKGNKLKVIMSREALDYWVKEKNEEAKQLIENPLIDLRYITNFDFRYFRIGVNTNKKIGLLALYNKDAGDLSLEGFTTDSKKIVDAIKAVFDRIFDNSANYHPTSN